jgi:mRNA interferase RelE/StbE
MYEIEISKQVKKFFSKHPDLKNKIVTIFTDIKESPFDKLIWDKYDLKKLKGLDETYRLRIGDYRVIFNVQEDRLIIFLIKADNRGQVYK